MEENKTKEVIIKSKDRNKEKSCFVITPIGEENSPIRRHIDGVINAAIRPALEFNYEVRVAHEFTSPGSINKQVIVEIYNADLVIANLTELNPNVMYELAVRHATKKPVIMIMEKGNKLPFDVVNERTIFYKNDFQGVLDLKEELIKAEKGIICNDSLSNPIYDSLQNYIQEESLIKKIESENSEDVDVLKSILYKISAMESRMIKSNSEVEIINDTVSVDFKIVLKYLEDFNDEEKSKIYKLVKSRLKDEIYQDYGIKVILFKSSQCNYIKLRLKVNENFAQDSKFINEIIDYIKEVIYNCDYKIDIKEVFRLNQYDN